MASLFGYTVSIRKIAPRSYDPGDTLSGQAYERGRFRPRFPMKPRWHRAPGEGEDFIPVWRTEAEALAIVERLKAAGIGERFTFEVNDVTGGVHAGGPNYVHPFRGVDGWTIPKENREVVSHWRPTA